MVEDLLVCFAGKVPGVGRPVGEDWNVVCCLSLSFSLLSLSALLSSFVQK